MAFYWLMIGILAVWRVTHLLHAEDGPADVFVRLRVCLGDSIAGRAMDCFYCLSMWISMPFAGFLGSTWPEKVLLWFALSGGAILVERVTARLELRPAFFEDPMEMEVSDVQLRK